jgi:hypothetical protein
MNSSNKESPTHFKGKDAIGHVAEAQALGIISASEVHGTEMPGHLSAAADAARETALLLPLLWAILTHLNIDPACILQALAVFSIGWIAWKLSRSAWLGWFRLERLHRVLKQEKWEIEHHRQQERDELRVLYGAKGFEGKLLEDVLDVLMADNDRLLKVMVEEELGLSLASQEHPLKQGLGAGLGTLAAVALILLAYWLWPPLGILIGAVLAMSLSAALSAYHSGNRLIPSVIWNLGLGILAFGFVYFLLEYICTTR